MYDQVEAAAPAINPEEPVTGLVQKQSSEPNEPRPVPNSRHPPAITITATTADMIFSALYADQHITSLAPNTALDLRIFKYSNIVLGSAHVKQIVQVQKSQIIVELVVNAPEWRDGEHILVAIPRIFLRLHPYTALIHFRLFWAPKPDSLDVPLTREAWPAHALIDNAFPS